MHQFMCLLPLLMTTQGGATSSDAARLETAKRITTPVGSFVTWADKMPPELEAVVNGKSADGAGVFAGGDEPPRRDYRVRCLDASLGVCGVGSVISDVIDAGGGD